MYRCGWAITVGHYIIPIAVPAVVVLSGLVLPRSPNRIGVVGVIVVICCFRYKLAILVLSVQVPGCGSDACCCRQSVDRGVTPIIAVVVLV